MILLLPSKYKNLLLSKNKRGKQVKLLQNYLDFYFILLFSLPHVSWCAIDTYDTCRKPEEGVRFPGDVIPESCRLLHGIECGSSGRADSTLDLWAFSLAWKTMWISKD